MIDIILEVARFLVTGVIFSYLIYMGQKGELQRQDGWRFIIAGFALIFLGTLVDITDNFPSLNRYVLIGDTAYQAFIEKVFGFLFGFMLLAYGLWLWIPIVVRDQYSKRKLRDSNEILEDRVRRRTDDLMRANEELLREVEERKEAQEGLEHSLREKEVLIREIHHRVKNNLQIVSSLLNLQSMGVDDEQMKSILLNSRNRVRAMGKIQEILYISPRLSDIDVPEYLNAISLYLYQSHQNVSSRVSLDFRVDKVNLDIDTLFAIGLILNELVTNAFRYAFPDGRKGTLQVLLESSGAGENLLMIRDDGIGFPEGLNIEEAPTLGMQIVKSMVHQIGGDLQLSRNGGTEFRIPFRKDWDSQENATFSSQAS